MRTAKQHYDEHLAAVYDWMAGGFEQAAKRNEQFFYQVGVDELRRGLAVDLGAGSGFQSIPLARLGFDVLAVDFSEDLLNILQERAAGLSVQIVHDDILNFAKHLKAKLSLIVCMGDTLTHIISFDDVRQFLSNSSRSLAENGMLILTFRDYHANELHGTQRFIPVRSDDDRVFTCFLEFSEEIVEVHDLLYEKYGSEWIFSASSYPKLRLDPAKVMAGLTDVGFRSVGMETENGMVQVIAQK